MTNKQAYAGLLKRLRSMAKSSSEGQRIMAQAKTARQTDRDDYPELASTGYSWAAPEETAEWQAAEAISSLLKALTGLVEANIKRGPFDEPLGSSEQTPEMNAAIAALSGEKL